MSLPLSTMLLIATLLPNGIHETQAVYCYACRSDDAPCNIGECQGLTCLKMETINMDNDRRTVYKSCMDEYEQTQCKQSAFGNKLNSRCTCDTNFCNGDRELEAAGLQTAPNSAISRTAYSFTYAHAPLMSVFILLVHIFVTALRTSLSQPTTFAPPYG